MNGAESRKAGEPRRTPTMSIVVPNYNHAHLIGQALRAIAGQTAAPFELIVVDDGSTDDSVARIRALAGDMPLQLHCHPENRGVAAAMNTGLGLVSGDPVRVLHVGEAEKPSSRGQMGAERVRRADDRVARNEP